MQRKKEKEAKLGEYFSHVEENSWQLKEPSIKPTQQSQYLDHAPCNEPVILKSRVIQVCCLYQEATDYQVEQNPDNEKATTNQSSTVLNLVVIVVACGP